MEYVTHSNTGSIIKFMTNFNVINHSIIELIREIYLYKIMGCRLADLKVQVSNISAHVTSTVI